jgi:hypothetical protein
MRERVDLKSPVREYRPPGSVRGASGNRRPYLDMLIGLPHQLCGNEETACSRSGNEVHDDLVVLRGLTLAFPPKEGGFGTYPAWSRRPRCHPIRAGAC